MIEDDNFPVGVYENNTTATRRLLDTRSSVESILLPRKLLRGSGFFKIVYIHKQTRLKPDNVCTIAFEVIL